MKRRLRIKRRLRLTRRRERLNGKYAGVAAVFRENACVRIRRRLRLIERTALNLF
jgi:hypothetical protein